MPAIEPRGPRKSAPADAELDASVDVLRLLAERTRLAILAMLDGTEMSVSSIAESLGRPVPAVSQHLAKLRAGGLVVSRRDGATVFYGQPDEHISLLVNNILYYAEHLLYDAPPHHGDAR
ncbi:ArsR/SmtB family transcription factor [Corynebacterium sp. 335C]